MPQAMDTMGRPRRRAEGRPLGRRGRPAGRSTRASTPRPVEAKDWMPEHYRKTLVRRSASTRTPRRRHAARGQLDQPRADRREAILLAKVQDEAGHGLYLYAAETLAPRATSWSTRSIPQGQVQLDLQLPDADLGRHGNDRLAVDGAAIMNQVPLCRCSYAVRARDGARLPRGVVPPAPGVRVAADDDDAQRRRARRCSGCRRPLVAETVVMFGPPDTESRTRSSR